jgi:hypothetical protein
MEKQLVKQLILVLLDNDIDSLIEYNNINEIKKKYPLINNKGYWKTWIFDLLKILNKLNLDSKEFTKKVLTNINKEDVIDEWTIIHLNNLLNLI